MGMSLTLALFFPFLATCHAGLLGAGTGGGSCAAAPFRSTSVQWPLGCPDTAPCCSEFGYCQIEANWHAGLFRDCNGVSNGRPLEAAAIAAENQAIANGDSRAANLLAVPAGSTAGAAAGFGGGYAGAAAATGFAGAGFGGAGAGVGYGAGAGFGVGAGGAGAGYGAGYGAGGDGAGGAGAGSGAVYGAGGAGGASAGAGYGAGYGAGGAGGAGAGYGAGAGGLVAFPNGAVVPAEEPAVAAARSQHLAAVAASQG